MTNARSIVHIPCLLILSLLATPSMAEPVSLSELRWKHRLIIAFSVAGSASDDVLRQWIDANACRLDDRDILVIKISEGGQQKPGNQSVELDSSSVQTLMYERRHANDPFEIILIGKDGGIKANSNSPDKLDDFIALIDTMPMRRQEAGQKKSEC